LSCILLYYYPSRIPGIIKLFYDRPVELAIKLVTKANFKLTSSIANPLSLILFAAASVKTFRKSWVRSILHCWS
jgi:hypothetical protein